MFIKVNIQDENMNSMGRLEMADYIIGAVAVIFVIYAAVSNIYLSFKDFTYYAALPTVIILVVLYLLHRHIYRLRNAEN
jgi:nitrogen fixation/metabolism regulation signal transduction histidine kinase